MVNPVDVVPTLPLEILVLLDSNHIDILIYFTKDEKRCDLSQSRIFWTDVVLWR
jgi:hypothetical protein